MKTFIKTLVSGAVGLTALYIVGKIAFQAGYDICEAENRYDQLQKGINARTERNDIPEATVESESEGTAEVAVPEKKQSKLGMLFGMRKLLTKGGTSVVTDLIQNPENHVIEASVKGREIHVNVKPRIA